MNIKDIFINKKNVFNSVFYDQILIFCVLCLSIIGLIMIFSSSVSISEKFVKNSFYFVRNHTFYLIFSILISLFTLNVPIKFWEKYNNFLLIISFFFLGMTIFSGKSVNGSSRWLSFKFISIQPSEFFKLTLFFYISDFLNKNYLLLKRNIFYFIKPMYVLIFAIIFLLLQPDLGTAIVLILTTLLVIFVFGIEFDFFLKFLGFCMFIVIVFVYFKPYSFHRILSFINPWNDPFGSGYQLTQSLMAFGRGGLFGNGLGNSIQKLEYLPEPHTDFILSIIAEELGYIGVMFILVILFIIVYRAIIISKKALDLELNYSGYLAFSIGICMFLQISINFASTLGIIPTKGLSLPFIGYGGTSLLIVYISMSILLRIDFETKFNNIQAFFVNK